MSRMFTDACFFHDVVAGSGRRDSTRLRPPPAQETEAHGDISMPGLR